MPLGKDLAKENAKYNARRAKSAEAMLKGYTSDDGLDTAITDALANLRHLCDAKGLDYGKLDKMAYRHYIAEIHGHA